MKMPSVGAEFNVRVWMDGRMDRQTRQTDRLDEANSSFRNFTNAPSYSKRLRSQSKQKFLTRLPGVAFCAPFSVVHFAFVLYLFHSLLLLSVFFHSSPPTYIASIYVFSDLHHFPQTQCNKSSSPIHAHDPEGAFLPVLLSIGDTDGGDDGNDNVDDADDPPTVQEKFKSRVNERDMNV